MKFIGDDGKEYLTRESAEEADKKFAERKKQIAEDKERQNR